MVVAAYPLAKIGVLLMKQLSKPLANIIKNEAKRNPTMRKYVVAPTGRAYSWIEHKTIMHVKGVKHQEVTEEEIIELGSNAIGEIVLFGLLCLCLMAEYNRQGDKKAVLEKTKAEEILNLQEVVLDLMQEVDNLKKTVNSIQEELIIASDVMEYEEQRHVQVHDHNFWDFWAPTNFKSKKSKSKSKLLDIDKSSPSN